MIAFSLMSSPNLINKEQIPCDKNFLSNDHKPVTFSYLGKASLEWAIACKPGPWIQAALSEETKYELLEPPDIKYEKKNTYFRNDIKINWYKKGNKYSTIGCLDFWR